MSLNIANASLVLIAAIALPVQAATQDSPGFSCQNGEISFVLGPAFTATCTGNLYIDPSSVIHADESITIVSGGNVTFWGTLVAPKISLSANRDLSVGGGLFSGLTDTYPDMTALSQVASGSLYLRTFDDQVSRPIVHPEYGAAITTLQMGVPVGTVEISTQTSAIVSAETSIESTDFVLAEPTAGLVPEPSTYTLFGVGGLMVMWAARRRAPKRVACISRSAWLA